jgi:hypothetical protein
MATNFGRNGHHQTILAVMAIIRPFHKNLKTCKISAKWQFIGSHVHLFVKWPDDGCYDRN